MSLEKLYKAIDERTKGEWTVCTDADNTDDIIRVDGERICGACCCGGITENDGAFITLVGTHADLIKEIIQNADVKKTWELIADDRRVARLIAAVIRLENALK